MVARLRPVAARWCVKSQVLNAAENFKAKRIASNAQILVQPLNLNKQNIPRFPPEEIFERVVDLNRIVGCDTVGSAFDTLWSTKDCFHIE
jgi:hypothetical protein